MSVYFTSLGFKPAAGQEQIIPSGVYTPVRFPYGVQENADPWDMHSRIQAGGRIVTYADPESGLIRPAVGGWGCLEFNVIWMDGDYTEIRDVFVRDPLGVPDETGYDHRGRTPGENCFTKTHWLAVRPGVPLGVQVAHDGVSPAKVRMAQFKLTIFRDVSEPAVPRPNSVRHGREDRWPDM